RLRVFQGDVHSGSVRSLNHAKEVAIASLSADGDWPGELRRFDRPGCSAGGGSRDVKFADEDLCPKPRDLCDLKRFAFVRMSAMNAEELECRESCAAEGPA